MDGEALTLRQRRAYDTGLLDTLHTAFTERFGIQVKTLSQGTGAALRTARDGDADVVIAHARRPKTNSFERIRDQPPGR